MLTSNNFILTNRLRVLHAQKNAETRANAAKFTLHCSLNSRSDCMDFESPLFWFIAAIENTWSDIQLLFDDNGEQLMNFPILPAM